MFTDGPEIPTHLMGWWVRYNGSDRPDERMFGVIPSEHIDWGYMP